MENVFTLFKTLHRSAIVGGMDKRDDCEKCGGTNVEAGFIYGTQSFSFVPFPRKWFTRRLVKVDARLCKDCGAVTFVADAKSLASYIEKSS